MGIKVFVTFPALKGWFANPKVTAEQFVKGGDKVSTPS
jgi:hypothetical protein